MRIAPPGEIGEIMDLTNANLLVMLLVILGVVIWTLRSMEWTLIR